VALLSPAPGRAQGDAKRLGSPDTYKVRWTGEPRDKFFKLLKGEEKPGKDVEKILDTAADHYIYRVTWFGYDPKLRLPPITTAPNELLTLVKDFSLNKTFAAKNQEFQKLWTKRLIAALEEIFELPVPENRIAVANGALLLPVYAKAQREEFGKFLDKLVADEKQHDVVKLFALKGLREYLPVRVPKASDEGAEKAAQRDRDTRRIDGILKFLNRKWEGKDPTVAAYLRRAALQTLAGAEAPALEVKDGKVVAPAAYALVLALTPEKDDPNLKPSFRASRLSVRAEAAIGVCRLRTRLLDAYQPEAGVYLTGRFLVDFVNEYRADYPRLKEQPKKGEPKAVALLPWKLAAERLIKALDELKENLSNKGPFFPKAVTMIEEAKAVLTLMTKAPGRVEAPENLRARVNELAKFAATNATLYRGVEKYRAVLSADE
jgi:hypothetical protein